MAQICRKWWQILPNCCPTNVVFCKIWNVRNWQKWQAKPKKLQKIPKFGVKTWKKLFEKHLKGRLRSKTIDKTSKKVERLTIAWQKVLIKWPWKIWKRSTRVEKDRKRSKNIEKDRKRSKEIKKDRKRSKKIEKDRKRLKVLAKSFDKVASEVLKKID